MEVVPLHQNLTLLPQCCAILNEEWPRSETARLHSLEKSCDELPCSLVLIEKVATVVHVIGHSRLCRVICQNDACWVESVVITKEKRGKGLGKLLMELTEDYARRMGFTLIHLSTHDKQEFYKKLGYSFCSPIQLFGSPSHTFNKAKCKLLNPGNVSTPPESTRTKTDNIDARLLNNQQLISNSDSIKQSKEKCIVPKKQPPLPPPPQVLNQNCVTNDVPKKQWMKKTLLLQPNI